MKTAGQTNPSSLSVISMKSGLEVAYFLYFVGRRTADLANRQFGAQEKKSGGLNPESVRWQVSAE